MSEDYLIDQVNICLDDYEVIDFINDLTDEYSRKSILKALDMNKGEDSFIVLRKDDEGKPGYYVIVKSGHSEDGGLILYSSGNPEALIVYLTKVYERMLLLSVEAKDAFLAKLNAAAELLREMAQNNRQNDSTE